MNYLIPMQCDNCNIRCPYVMLQKIKLADGFDIQLKIICRRKKFVIASKIISELDLVQFINNKVRKTR